MRRISMLLGLVLSLAIVSVPRTSRAQVAVRIDLGLPAAPPMVVVQPGVQVVEGSDDEVFFTRGFYWARRGPYWYRARGPGAPFAMVDRRFVPAEIYRVPPGHYRHWHHDRQKEERREWKEARRDEHRAWKEERRDERREWRGSDRGRRHGGRDQERPVVAYGPAPRPSPMVAPAPRPGPHDAPGYRNPSPGPHDAPGGGRHGPHDAN